MENNWIYKFKKKISVYWLYTKYQILTKMVLMFICFPLYNKVVKELIYSTNRVSISSGDYVEFLLSKQGLAMLILTILFAIILVGLDINAFIIMSSLIQENRVKLTARRLLIVSIKSIKNLLNPSGLIIIIYTALVVPLVGFGFGISVTKNFKIPNFIIDVIYKNKFYLSLYIVGILFLTMITIFYIFLFHYLVICNETVKNSLSKSYKLMKKYWREFLKEFILKTIVVYFLIFFVLFFILVLLLINVSYISNLIYRRCLIVFLMLILAEIIGYATFMFLPVVCNKVTELFYRFNKYEGINIRLGINIYAEDIDKDLRKKVSVRTKLVIFLSISILFIGNVFLSIICAYNFNEIFNLNKDIFIVAHRAGGDLAAENSLLGLKKAINEGARYSEIDVQRTKDGKYIINHDPTFSRLCGVNKSSSELTLAEINKLKIKDLFDKKRKSQHVSTLDEFLDESRGKIGLFIELKGKTADKKMADDVIKMVKEKHLEKNIVVLSLDYNLINYIEKKYPKIDTGYLYFFSIGETKKLKSDYLIMEEREATESNIDKIHSEGKKAIVWTVNSEDSINKFLNSDVDGVITDYVLNVKKEKLKLKKRSDYEIIVDKLFN